jgi:glycosyltransferase involved in cell wall biosynthesis
VKEIINIGIDASRSTSGGAIAHLNGILSEFDNTKYGIAFIYVWAPKLILDRLPQKSWLIKCALSFEKRNIAYKLWWQYWKLPLLIEKFKCSILLNTDAGTVCNFKPAVTVHQDMLAFEAGEIRRAVTFKKLLRLIALYYIQINSLKRSAGVIFLTDYAKNKLLLKTGLLRNSTIIPHGVDEHFRCEPNPNKYWDKNSHLYTITYVSNVASYKHQNKVVSALKLLNSTKLLASLLLVGGKGPCKLEELLESEIKKVDPQGKFIKRLCHVPNNELPAILMRSDIFLFASSCETMPVTLIEAMASGLPIACSSRGPMPEILSTAGVYFDPEDPTSICNAILKLIESPSLCYDKACIGYNLAKNFSWKRCADETFTFILKTLSRHKNNL